MFRILSVSFPPGTSSSHRSEKSSLSVGEEIEEDLSVELDDANSSDKVRGGHVPWRRLFAASICGKASELHRVRKATVEAMKSQ